MHSSTGWRAGTALALLTTTVAVTACGSEDGGGGAGGGKRKVSIAFEQVVSGVPFAVVQRQGAEAAARDDGAVDLSIAGPSQIEPVTAQKQATDQLARRPDGFAVSPFPPDLWQRTLRDIAKDTDGAAIAVDLKPVGLPDQLGSTPIRTFVGANDTQQAETIAREMVSRGDLTPGTTGTVLVGQCVPGEVGSLAERTAGFRRVFQRLLPQAKVKVFDSKGDPTGNTNAWTQQLRATPDVVAATGDCDQDGSSLAKIKARSPGDYVVGALEDPPEVLRAVKDGSIVATVTQRRFLQGYLPVALLADAKRTGKPLPQGWIDVGTTTVDRANVDEIIRRNASAQATAAWYRPTLARALAEARRPKPLADAWKPGA